MVVTIFACLVSMTGLLPALPVHAASSSEWFGAGDPAVINTGSAVITDIPKKCTDRTYVVRPAKTVPLPQSELTTTGCYTTTLLGDFDDNGYVNLPGTNQAASIVNSSGTRQTFLAIPNSDVFIFYSTRSNGSTADGLFLSLERKPKFTPAYNSASGEASMILNITPANRKLVADRAGHGYDVDTGTKSFSAGGDYLMAYAHGIGFIRVNLTTFEVTPFGDTFNYGLGIGPAIRTAISADGRYAFASSFNFSYSKMFDLATCGPVPDSVLRSVSCQSRDLQNFLASKINNYAGLIAPDFLSNTTMAFYGMSKNGVTTTYARYAIIAPGTSYTTNDYLGLGDSFSSGEGARLYENGTDTDQNKCHLSKLSYPYLAARDLDFNDFHSVACSGAVSYNVNKGSGIDSSAKKFDRDNQNYDPVKSFDYTDWDPGFKAQIGYVQKYQPNVITLSAIGNDIGFKGVVTRCTEPDTCYSTYEDRYELAQEMNSKFSTLVTMYTRLKKAAPKARIYVLGYPEVADPSGQCASNVHLNASELQFANDLVIYLNGIIARAAANAGVFYADTTTALTGHRLCEAKGSNVGVNGVTGGNDVPNFTGGPLGNESFHPNALGNQLLEAALLAKTAGLTAAMPAPDPSSKPRAITDDLVFLNQPASGRAIKQVNYDNDLSNDIVYRSGTWGAFVNGRQFVLQADGQVQAWVNSTPVHLGDTVTDSEGNISASFAIPATLPTGFHTLHLYTKNLLGADIDIQKVVYVAASPTDFDGDGIVNSQEKCLVGEAVNQDADQDGIDDACDDAIGEAPTPVASSQKPAANTTPAAVSQTTTPAADTPVSKPQILTPASTNQASRSTDSSVLGTSTLEPSASGSEPTETAPLGIVASVATAAQKQHLPLYVLVIATALAAGVVAGLIGYIRSGQK